MNIALNTVEAPMSTLALFGASFGAEKPAFDVSISQAGQAMLNQDATAIPAILPANGISETLKAALVCMLLS